MNWNERSIKVTVLLVGLLVSRTSFASAQELPLDAHVEEYVGAEHQPQGDGSSADGGGVEISAIGSPELANASLTEIFVAIGETLQDYKVECTFKCAFKGGYRDVPELTSAESSAVFTQKAETEALAVKVVEVQMKRVSSNSSLAAFEFKRPSKAACLDSAKKLITKEMRTKYPDLRFNARFDEEFKRTSISDVACKIKK